jgi:hypothetical protein
LVVGKRAHGIKREKDTSVFVNLSCDIRVIVARLQVTFLNCRATMAF